MAMLGLMLMLPPLLPVHAMPIASFYAEWLAFALGLLGVLALLGKAGASHWQLPRIALAPLLLLLVVALQLACAMYAYAASAITVMAYLLWCALLALAGRSYTQALGAEPVTATLAWCLFAGSVVNAVCGLLQFAHLADQFGPLISAPLDTAVFGIYGNLAQQNHFATHMALGIASAVYLWRGARLMTAWFGASMLVLLSALLLSSARSSLLYLAWLLGLAAWQARRGPRWPARRRMLWLGAGAAAVGLGALWLASRGGAALPQLARLVSMSGALGPRLYLWQHALQMAAEHPLLGVGFDAFAYRLVEQLGHSQDAIVWGVDQYAHNLILQLLAVSGLAGLLAVGAPAAAFVRRQWRAEVSPARLWAWGILGVLLIHSMLEQPLYYSYFLGPFALLAGSIDPAAWALRGGRAARAAVAVLLAAALGLLCKTARDYVQLESQFYSADADAGAPASQAAQRRALVLALDQGSLFGPLAQLLAPEEFVSAQAAPAAKLALNARLMHYAPTADTEFRHAALLAEDGQPARALAQFEQAANAYPEQAQAYLERVQALAARDAAHYGALAQAARAVVPAAQARARPQAR